MTGTAGLRMSSFAVLVLANLLSAWAFLLMPCEVRGQAIAKADPVSWPGSLDSRADFDAASRATLLGFADALESDLPVPGPFASGQSRSSVNKWLAAERGRLLANYWLASRPCTAADWTCAPSVKTYADFADKSRGLPAVAPPQFQTWWNEIKEFSRTYIAEQIRLAALFPETSSEIDLFNNNERNGDELPDRQFFLTFDDGPSAAGGATDATLAMLAKERKSAVFFVLGDAFQSRLAATGRPALTDLYGSNCVGSHGWEHKSHATWDGWQSSIERTQALLAETVPHKNLLPFFRPPFGERRADSDAFFRQHGLKVVLWNLDSLDWSDQVDAQIVGNRVLTLMLLKRRGLILFHDVHPKAAATLPALFQRLGKAVDWGDCHRLNPIRASR
jgi:peptidoglycan/xylan/chitin deacetylase (PgdA/CDA1 family)